MRKNFTSGLISWVMTLLISVCAALLIRTYCFEVFEVPSSSMANTLKVNDRLMVNKLDKTPQKGDIVVFRAGGGFAQPGDPDLYVKRVIATEGDTVWCCGENGEVKVNDTSVDEPYISSPTSKFSTVTLGPGEVWVMGDNRSNSSDSRFRGPIDETQIVGTAFVKVWPFSRMGTLE